MGLSGPKFRRKLDYDPNNTRWTRDETTFGQKILRSQGWEPGKYLGAQDSAHSQLHSAASLAPIKINLKDDTLGLGAKIRQKQSDECTGLDVFKDLLGRLNGKSEEALEQQRQVRSEIKTNLFVERKYGPMRFVSGGFLVGDQKMQELVDNKPATTPVKEEPKSEASEPETMKKEMEKKEKKSKKRKASESEGSDASDSKSGKKRKKRSKADKESESNEAETEKSAKKKKDKKRKRSEHSDKVQEEENSAKQAESEVKRKKSKKSKDVSQQTALSNSSAEISEDDTSEKIRRKEKKRDKKRKQANSAEGSEAIATSNSSAVTPQDSGTSTPSNTGASTPQNLSARHLARSRYIASKKMAYSDMQAMNQIFMVKPV
ncbi:hypothetical protein F5B22DRAFT_642888 [Xylaria bambusicola]|uniref:uncharacterized protein n=1 Tax=Xylaria bambusicola TaxID=326684 RepID=UPI002007E59E|nr:uncharacterized protein F5B22DRAFT_642888 [Xylaria bambusicola]KAI0523786.1 hypothetical protein F5B22DRAFT_642888 [Xylaria bambusicola]